MPVFSRILLTSLMAMAMTACCTSDGRVKFAGTATPIPLPDEVLVLIDESMDDIMEEEIVEIEEVEEAAEEVVEEVALVEEAPKEEVVRRDVAPGGPQEWAKALGSTTINFPEDLAALSRSELRQVRRYSRFLQRFSDMKMVLVGHTDLVGTREYNLGLAERRAQKVKETMVARGIDPARIQVLSLGEEFPVVNSDSDAANARNRRVDVSVSE